MCFVQLTRHFNRTTLRLNQRPKANQNRKKVIGAPDAKVEASSANRYGPTSKPIVFWGAEVFWELESAGGRKHCFMPSMIVS